MILTKQFCALISDIDWHHRLWQPFAAVVNRCIFVNQPVDLRTQNPLRCSYLTSSFSGEIYLVSRFHSSTQVHTESSRECPLDRKTNPEEKRCANFSASLGNRITCWCLNPGDSSLHCLCKLLILQTTISLLASEIGAGTGNWCNLSLKRRYQTRRPPKMNAITSWMPIVDEYPTIYLDGSYDQWLRYAAYVPGTFPWNTWFVSPTR